MAVTQILRKDCAWADTGVAAGWEFLRPFNLCFRHKLQRPKSVPDADPRWNFPLHKPNLYFMVFISPLAL